MTMTHLLNIKNLPDNLIKKSVVTIGKIKFSKEK
jgi:hypothetical protein